jgi:hypothetical protein
MYTKFQSENLNGSNLLEYTDADGRIILKLILKKYVEMDYTRLIWLRIRRSNEIL